MIRTLRTPRFVAVALAAVLLAPAAGAAQTLPFGPDALALGASADAALCGVDLLDPNAAGIGVDCGRPVARFRVVFPPTLAARWLSNGPDDVVGGQIGDVVEGLDNGLSFDGFTAADRRAIVAGVPIGGWDLDGAVEFPLVALVYGGFGASVAKSFQVEGTLPRDLVALLLEGRSPDRDTYDLDAFDLSVLAVTRYTAGYMRELRPGWTVGGSASLLTGTLNGHYEAGPVTIDPATGAAEFDLRGGWAGGAALEDDLFGFRLPDGAGFGLDLGTRYTVGGLTGALAVENLLSGMWWPERTLVVETHVTAGTDRTITATAVRDTVESPGAELAGIRDGIEAYEPALRVRAAVAYALDIATLGFGYVLEPGDGRLYATGDGWDLGLALYPWRTVGLQLSVGHWRGPTRGAGVTLALGSFLLQGGYRSDSRGGHAAFSVGLVQ